MAKTDVQQFAALLTEQKSLTEPEAISLARDFRDRSIDATVDFLLEEGLVQKPEILNALSRLYQVPYLDVTGYFFEHDLVHSFPEDFLTGNTMVPVDLEEGILGVVTNDPRQEGLVGRIAQHFPNANIEFMVGIKRDIIDAIREFHRRSLTAEDEEQFEEATEDIVDKLS